MSHFRPGEGRDMHAEAVRLARDVVWMCRSLREDEMTGKRRALLERCARQAARRVSLLCTALEAGHRCLGPPRPLPIENGVAHVGPVSAARGGRSRC